LSSYPIAPSPFAPSPSTFASRFPMHHLRQSRRWLVVVFSARPEKSLARSLSQEVYQFREESLARSQRSLSQVCRTFDQFPKALQNERPV
jgi:hypothetical protein